MTRSAPVPNKPPIHWVPGALFPAVKRPGCEANHLVRRLRMSGAIPPFPLYSFMVRIRTVSPFVFFCYRIYLRDSDISRHTNLILIDPCIVDYSAEIPTRCSFVIEFIIPKFFEGSTCFERHTAHHQEL
jgi:hypothetical protein